VLFLGSLHKSRGGEKEGGGYYGGKQKGGYFGDHLAAREGLLGSRPDLERDRKIENPGDPMQDFLERNVHNYENPRFSWKIKEGNYNGSLGRKTNAFMGDVRVKEGKSNNQGKSNGMENVEVMVPNIDFLSKATKKRNLRRRVLMR
jgi:hypothetical protein